MAARSRTRAAARAAMLALGLLVTLMLTPAASRAASAQALPPQPAPPQLAVTGASLTVASTGQQLYGLHSATPMLVASTTKLMTALVVLQHVHNLSTVFTQTDWEAPPIDSQIGLVPGERMTVHDLLLALMLPSADDAAIDLAYNVGGGSIARFVGMMNAEARALGLAHTHFQNPIGLDSPENRVSPYDLTRLAAYDMQHSAFFRRIVALRSAVLHSGNHVRYIVNRDDLVGKVPWINGVKTGHTNAAGYILVSSGTRDGLTLIGSVLGTSSEAARDAAALTLLSWGFDEFHQVAPVKDGQVLARLPVTDQSLRAAVTADGGYSRVVPREDRVQVRLKLPRELSGPMRRHAVVGHARVIVGGRQVASIPLRLARAIPGLSPYTQVIRFLGGGITLMVLVLAIVAVAAIVALRRRRPAVLRPRRLEER